MQKARGIVITIAVTFVVVLLLSAIVIYSGLYDVSASRDHTVFVKATLSTISDRSIATHSRGITPVAVDSAGLLEGAEHFHEMCVVCHGAPGVAKGEIAEGLNPRAPELSKHSAGEMTESQIFWIVKNGIKFTGMPSFQSSHTDEQIWQIAAFVKKLDHMTEAQYQQVIEQVKAANGGVLPESEGAVHEHGGMDMDMDSTKKSAPAKPAATKPAAHTHTH